MSNRKTKKDKTKTERKKETVCAALNAGTFGGSGGSTFTDLSDCSTAITKIFGYSSGGSLCGIKIFYGATGVSHGAITGTPIEYVLNTGDTIVDVLVYANTGTSGYINGLLFYATNSNGTYNLSDVMGSATGTQYGWVSPSYDLGGPVNLSYVTGATTSSQLNSLAFYWSSVDALCRIEKKKGESGSEDDVAEKKGKDHEEGGDDEEGSSRSAKRKKPRSAGGKRHKR